MLSSAGRAHPQILCSTSVFPRGDVFSDISLLLKVVQHRSGTVTFYLLLNVLCKSRLDFRVFVKSTI